MKPSVGTNCFGLPAHWKAFVFAAITIYSAVAVGQPEKLNPPAESPANLDFEIGEPGQIPSGWTLQEESRGGGYEVVLTEERAHNGRRRVVLRSKKPAPSGTLMQTIDASRYRGKRVRFRAYARVGSLGRLGQLNLWLRVERPEGIGFIDNMLDRPIVSTEWTPYEIVGDVDLDADSISFGFQLTRDGSARFDSASIELVSGSNVSMKNPAHL